jgi:hypothetical protein
VQNSFAGFFCNAVMAIHSENPGVSEYEQIQTRFGNFLVRHKNYLELNRAVTTPDRAFERLLESGYQVDGPLCKWCKASDRPKFNCHTYAVGDFLELSPVDWVEGRIISTQGIVQTPMAAILNQRFERVAKFDLADIHANDNSITASKAFREDDVATFKTSSFSYLDYHVEYYHSGKLKRRAGVWWVESKMGEGPIFMIPLLNFIYYYIQPGRNIELEIHRFSPYKLPHNSASNADWD